MNRTQALKTLGLPEDASDEDIKTAYRESAQILHPDRFAGDEKLGKRATEQFKNLQEAYALLTANGGGRTRGSRGPGAAGARPAGASARSTRAARLAGIAAARVQLVRMKDVALDERRNGLFMAVGGGLVALVFMRRTYGLLRAVAALASAVCVWGIVQTVSAQRTLHTLDKHLAELMREQESLEGEPEEAAL